MLNDSQTLNPKTFAVKMYGGFEPVRAKQGSRGNNKTRRKKLNYLTKKRIREKGMMVDWYRISYWDSNVSCLKCYEKCDGRVPRKLAKIAVILICMAVCAYQVFQFMQLYMKYPTTVDVEIELLEFSGLPGITVCNRNILKRSLACGSEETKHLCKNFTSLNDYNKHLFDTIEHMTTVQLKHFGHQLNTMIHSCKAIREGEEEETDMTKLCKEATWVFNGRLGCFVINDQWSSAEHSTFSNLISFAILLDLEEGEYLSKLEEVAADIYIHSSYVIPTPRISGYRAEVDKRYSLGFRKTTLKLLQPPYATMCRNYRQLRKSNENEPSCQTNCFLQCEWDLHMDHCKCIPPEVPLVQKSIKCSAVNQKDCPASLTKQHRVKCDENCPPDCEVHLYDVSKVNDKISELTVTLNESSKSFTYISIDLKSQRQILYSHKPRFTSIELFSYVGGYLSIWLGLSFPLVYGYLESLCFFCCDMKSTRKVKRKTASPLKNPKGNTINLKPSYPSYGTRPGSVNIF